MALANAVQNSRRTPQRITWQDEDGDAIDLTGATLTGRIRNQNTGTTVAIDGTLSIVTAASGIFDWTYGSTDVGTAGDFLVQFVATYGDGTADRTLLEAWSVIPAI